MSARRILSAAMAAVAVAALCSVVSAAGDPLEVLRAVEQAFIQVAQRVSPSVVSISIQREVPETRQPPFDRIPEEDWRRFFDQPLSAGSGVIIRADGLILTNNHVVEGAEAIQVRLADGRPFAATLVKADQRSDLAVLRIPAKDLTPARFNESGRVSVGQWVIALGNPFGFGRDGRATMTHGVVSAVGRSLPALGVLEDRYYGSLIQTDAPINPGNSGGPLLNIDGQVIGINSAIYSTSRGSQGIGFAIPIDAKTLAVIAKLSRGEEVEYGYLGVGIRTVDEDAASRLGVPPRAGALVERVMPDTPAAEAGLQKDDVIVVFNSLQVANEDELIREVGATPVGSRCTVEVIRRGQHVTLTLTLGKRPVGAARTQPAPRVPPRAPDEPDEGAREGTWRGITVQPLTAELAERLGLGDTKGVLVGACARNSPAYAAGIRPGFVIDQIGKTRIDSVADFNRVTRDLPASWKGLVHTNKGFFVIGPE